jgi:hypothetical protein
MEIGLVEKGILGAFSFGELVEAGSRGSAMSAVSSSGSDLSVVWDKGLERRSFGVFLPLLPSFSGGCGAEAAKTPSISTWLLFLAGYGVLTIFSLNSL